MTVTEKKLWETLKAIAGYIERVDPKTTAGGAEGMLALVGVMATETLAEVKGPA